VNLRPYLLHIPFGFGIPGLLPSSEVQVGATLPVRVGEVDEQRPAGEPGGGVIVLCARAGSVGRQEHQRDVVARLERWGWRYGEKLSQTYSFSPGQRARRVLSSRGTRGVACGPGPGRRSSPSPGPARRACASHRRGGCRSRVAVAVS
jgi:hypothetical protein